MVSVAPENKDQNEEKKDEKPFVLWKEELRRVWCDLRGPAASPGRAAAAVALGMFIGCQPVFGVQTPLVLVLCLWLRLDALVAWIAANVSNPFFAPFLLTGEVWVGGSLLEGRPIDLHGRFGGFWDAIQSAPKLLLVGAPVVGLALAIVSGALAFAFVWVRRRLGVVSKAHVYVLPANAPPWVRAAERVASRYVSLEGSTPRQRTQFNYVRIKLMSDPIAKLVTEVRGEESLGAVYDVGTGRGQLPILLLELGRATSARGVDWDERKIEDANAAAEGARGDDLSRLDARFEVQDARECRPEPSDTVLLIDLLHYFQVPEQDAILDRAAAAVRPGGVLLVREADTERGWRSWMTLFEERLFTALRFNRGERVRFQPARAIAERIRGAGLETEIRPAWGKTPFSNVLVIGRRPVG